MNGHADQIDVTPLSEQLRPARRPGKLPNGGIRGKAVSRSATYSGSQQRSFSVPPKSSVMTPRKKTELDTTPRSAQDRVKQAMERAARRTGHKLRVPDLGTPGNDDFRRSRSLNSQSQSSSRHPSSKGFFLSTDAKTRRVATLRKKLNNIVSELETIEKASNIDGGSPSGLSAGWELAIREGQKKEEYLQGLLNQALEEIKLHRLSRGKVEEELSRLRVSGKTSLDEELKVELQMAGCLPTQSVESIIAQLRTDLSTATRERDAYKMQLDIYNERSPTRYNSVPPKKRDGLKRIELEARCATLEQMVKSQEMTRSQFLLPNVVRSILGNCDIDPDVQDRIMGDIHDYLQGREKGENSTTPTYSPRPSSYKSSPPVSPPTTDIHHSAARNSRRHVLHTNS